MKPNQSDLTYVSWAVTCLHSGTSKALNSFNSAWTIQDWESLQSKTASFIGREGRKEGQLVAFGVHKIIFSLLCSTMEQCQWVVDLPSQGFLVSSLRVRLDVLYLCKFGGTAGYSCAGWSLHKGAWLRSEYNPHSSVSGPHGIMIHQEEVLFF